MRPAPLTPLMLSTITRGGNQPARGQGQERQVHGGRVATGIGDQGRALDLFPISLAQAVDGLVDQIRCGVFDAVPARVDIRIGQAVVGAQVDHGRAGGVEGPHRLHGLGVGQGQEHDIHLVRPPEGVGQRNQFNGPRTVHDIAVEASGTVLAGQPGDFGVWVPVQQPDQFQARVAGWRRQFPL